MRTPAIILCALLCMASRHPDRMIRSDLALNASFNRGDATDRSMYNATPTLAGNAVVTAGQRYLSLDGAGDYLRYGDADQYSFNVAGQDQPFSVSGWVYHSAAVGSGYIDLLRKGAGGAGVEYVVRVANGGFGVSIVAYSGGSGSVYRGRSYSVNSASGQWIHWCMTYSGNEATTGFKIYKNGVAVDDGDVSAGSYTGMVNGTLTVDIGQYLNGLVDDVRIYTRVLSAADAAAIYSSGRE